MDLEIKSKTVLITGGSAGIGLATAHVLAGEGCKVALSARDPKRLAIAAAEVRARHGTEVEEIQADMSSLAGVEATIDKALAKLGRVDVLVNNAGSIRAGAFLEIPDAQWTEDWNLKVLGYVRAARLIFPLMQEQGGGHIINVIGSAARQANQN